MEVALKSLNPNSPDGNETKFLKEAAIMGQFLHTNVVKLLGVVTVGEPVGSKSKCTIGRGWGFLKQKLGGGGGGYTCKGVDF